MLPKACHEHIAIKRFCMAQVWQISTPQPIAEPLLNHSRDWTSAFTAIQQTMVSHQACRQAKSTSVVAVHMPSQGLSNNGTVSQNKMLPAPNIFGGYAARSMLANSQTASTYPPSLPQEQDDTLLLTLHAQHVQSHNRRIALKSVYSAHTKTRA